MVLEWVVRDVRGDGSCFYRAMYQSAVHTDHIKTIMRRMKIDYKKTQWTEDMFVKAARNSLSQAVMSSSRRSGQLEAMYNYLYETRKQSKMTYAAILENYPVWFQKHYKRLPPTFNEFRDTFAKCILVTRNWVSEIEVRLLLDILKGVPISIRNAPPKPRERLSCDIMYLLNLGECHYNYILCRDCEPNVINPPTSRCISKTGNIGKRLRANVT